MIKRVHLVLTFVITVTVFTSNCVDAQDVSFKRDFSISERTLIPNGRNEFFILEPGFQLVLEGESGLFNNVFERLEITVLDETKEVDGIKTRVVEEREWKNEELYEVARNFFAIDQENGDVFYFGEEVDFYEDGKIINHKGAWLAGDNDARAGLIIPGAPAVGLKYYQELAEGVAMDRAEIISLDEDLETPAGLFKDCLKTKEGTALNLAEKEYKTYASGIGLIQDQHLLLVSYGFIGEN